MNGNDPRGRMAPVRALPPDDDLSAARLSVSRCRSTGSAPRRLPILRRVTGAASLRPGIAMRLSTEFVAGVLAGGLLGWGCDRLLGTKPWGLIVLLVLGFGAGIYNVMRVSGFFPAADTKKGPPGP